MASLPQPLNAAIFHVTQVWNRSGWIGVDLFFVLSGFLVSGLLFRELRASGKLRLGRFFVRRGLKIYPSFWVLVAATVCVYPLRLLVPGLWYELAFLQNYGPAMWPHTWSLAVEEHFYLLLGLSLFLIERRRGAGSRRDALLAGCAAVLVGCLVARIIETSTMPYSIKKHLCATHLRLDSLAFGVLLSYFFHFHPEATASFFRGFRWAILAVSLLLIASVAGQKLETSDYVHTFGLTSLYLGFGALMMLALYSSTAERASRTGIGRILGYTGARSYSVYLWHVPVVYGLNWLVRPLRVAEPQWLPVVEWPVYVVLAFLVGVLAANLIELPVMKLRDRLFPAPRVARAAPPELPRHAVSETAAES